jgi:hypothetical protein
MKYWLFGFAVYVWKCKAEQYLVVNGVESYVFLVGTFVVLYVMDDMFWLIDIIFG